MAKQLWTIDPMHSEIMFKVKHMLITNVSGTFDVYKASMRADADDFSDMEFEFEAEVDSINTRNSHRDTHLRSNDFFDATNHPTLVCRSRSVKKTGQGSFEVTADFTIRGVTRMVPLKVEYTGTGLDLYGQRKAGFEISAQITRQEFGLTWNATTEDGRLALDDLVHIVISTQMIKQTKED